jgi:glycerol-3-phosphate acyltransferase PlsX
MRKRMRRIVVDAMGGDHAPGPEVEGAISAVRERAIAVTLVGDETLLRERIEKHQAKHPTKDPVEGQLDVHHASQVVTMDDHPGTAFKTKKDSSMRVAFNLVAEGKGDAVVSAGNSGAMLACGLFVMKRVPGLERPGITTLCPTRTHSPCVVLDVGANIELKARALAQFAVLGATYARTMLGREAPRVGVLSNGEEQSKGTDLTREAHRLLTALAPKSGFEFRGYAEGRDVFSGDFDVVVTDGFTGNVALKVYEGTARFIFETLEIEVRRSRRMMVGAALLKPALRAMRRVLEPDEHGGAVLLGLDGVAVISHGRSTGKAIKNAIFAAARQADAGLTPALAAAIADSRHQLDTELASAAEG